MTKQELIASVENQTVSDEQVFENLKVYATQYEDMKILTREDQIEYEEVSMALHRLRPQVMKMLETLVIEEHDGCCCKRPE